MVGHKSSSRNNTSQTTTTAATAHASRHTRARRVNERRRGGDGGSSTVAAHHRGRHSRTKKSSCFDSSSSRSARAIKRIRKADAVVVTSGARPLPKKDRRSTNKKTDAGSSSTTTAAPPPPDRRPSAAASGGVDFEHKRKRLAPVEDSGRKKGHLEGEPENSGSTSELKKPEGRRRRLLRPVVHNRNKTRRKGAIFTTPSSSSSTFLDGEAEEAPSVAASSSSSRTAIERRLNSAVDNHSPATKKKKQPRLVAAAKSPKIADGGQRETKRSKVETVGSRRISGLKRQKTSSSNVVEVVRPMDTKRDTLPKRKASLDAHSAMVALTLQMQRPVLVADGRKRKDSMSSTVDAVAKVPGKPEAKDGKKKAATPTKRKASANGSPEPKTSPKKAKSSPVTTPKKQKADPPVLHDPPPPVIPVFQHPVQCTCQSPPACPLHYQLQCACHRPPSFHHHPHQSPVATVMAPGSATSMGFVGGTSTRAPSAAALISSIFPFQTTPSSSGVTQANAAIGGGYCSGNSIPGYTTQPQATASAWHPSAWAFPGATHMLATVATPATSVQQIEEQSSNAGTTSSGGPLSGGFPAVFQGHLFFGTSPLTPASFVVSADSCNLTVHSAAPQPPVRHPTPPVISSTSQSPDSMVAKNKTMYELIRGDDEASPSLTLKLSKKSSQDHQQKSKKMTASTAATRKRKTSSSSGGSGDGSLKKKKQKSNRKSSTAYEFEQTLPSSNFATSSWEPVGTPIRKWVYVNNDAKPLKRDCYAAIRHKQETDTVIQIRDCIVVNSGDNSSQSQQYGESGAPSKRSYVGKVADFFTSPNGTLWVSLAWYYWPEQAEVTSIDDLYVFQTAHPKELLASRHIDCVSVDSIEDVAYVVTFNEYNRYVSENKAEALALPSVIVDGIVPRAWSAYARRRLMPAEDTDDGLVYFCRRVYDFHGKRILRNPSF